jgi:hypothetical protein
MGVGLEQVRVAVEAKVKRGKGAPEGHIPFTARAKKVLELSLREALQLGHNYIGTEHILLGLLREGEGVAAAVLTEMGVEFSAARAKVLELLEGYSAPLVAAAGKPTATVSAPVNPPACPTCGASLQGRLRVRSLDVEADSGETAAVAVAYCSSCGRSLGILPNPPSHN